MPHESQILNSQHSNLSTSLKFSSAFQKVLRNVQFFPGTSVHSIKKVTVSNGFISCLLGCHCVAQLSLPTVLSYSEKCNCFPFLSSSRARPCFPCNSGFSHCFSEVTPSSLCSGRPVTSHIIFLSAISLFWSAAKAHSLPAVVSLKV